MKYVVILGDGMADYPLPCLNGKTPLEAANKPNMDKICKFGTLGRMRTLYPDLPLGSDVANLSVLGYDPHLYYTGRSPVEALGLRIKLSRGDLVFRMNLVTLDGDGALPELTMLDHSSDKITTPEAAELVKALSDKLACDKTSFHIGVSYRHILIMKNTFYNITLTPPHDILGKKIGNYLPSGPLGEEITALMEKSRAILSSHPVNLRRMEKGLRPANCLWLWGEGTKPEYESFEARYGIKKGLVISAVPLLFGLAAGLGLDYTTVEGATGDYHTNYAGKGARAIAALKEGYEFVFVHIEAADECGHDGDAVLKTSAVEKIDEHIVGPIFDYLTASGESFRMLVAPDHATPVEVRTHTDDIIPFCLYDKGNPGFCGLSYCEENAGKTGIFYAKGHDLMGDFILK